MNVKNEFLRCEVKVDSVRVWVSSITSLKAEMTSFLWAGIIRNCWNLVGWIETPWNCDRVYQQCRNEPPLSGSMEEKQSGGLVGYFSG